MMQQLSSSLDLANKICEVKNFNLRVKYTFEFCPVHAGANPSESKNRYCSKPLSLSYIGQNFMGNTYLACF